jgi:acyl carrier protein
MPVKEAVRVVWQEVLAHPVTDDSDFFALGGDSLAALSICARLEERFLVRPRLRVLFDQPRFDDYANAYSSLVEEGTND